MRNRFVVLVLGVVLGLASASAHADVLELKSGDLLAGKAESLDDEGVTFVAEKGGSMRVAWDRVVPRCRYDLTKASLAADDAPGRIKLAKWCLAAGLHRSARRELLEAKGLGTADADGVDSLLAEVRRAEADTTLDTVDALVERGELDQALEKVKGYLRAADPGVDADRVRARVPDLLQRIERRDDEVRQADEDRKKAEKDGRLKDWIERTMKGADQKKDDAAAAATDGFTQLAKGSQTRARDALAKGESKYQSARADYVRVRKVVKEGEVADQCADRVRECNERTVEILIRWGRLEVQNKSWKAASAIVDRGLKVDPVDRELLELRSTIDANWLRKKLSDVTNAHGHASGN